MSSQSNSSQHILEIDSVTLCFGNKVILSGAYLKMETGKVSALLGRNGCGKSCLMKIIFGELQAQFKSMRIDDIWHSEFSCRDVCYLPQHCSIPKNLTVLQAFDDFEQNFDDFCEIFPEFSFFGNFKISRLSGGLKRIVETYLVLCSPSDFVMLDEPFSQVTMTDIEKIKQLILREKERKGILLTDHMYQNIIDIADSTYVLANQTVYLTKSKDDLIKYGYLAHL